jgi:hypothetical protein
MEECYAQFNWAGKFQRESGYSPDDGQALIAFFTGEGPVRVPWKGLVRHHVAGDVLINDEIDWNYVKSMNTAHEHRPDVTGFTYTHGWRRMCPSDFYARNLTVNASCDTVQDVLTARAAGWPTVMTVPDDETRKRWNEDGVDFLVCPQQTDPRITCALCKLCTKKDRKWTIVFKAHGTAKVKLSRKLAKMQGKQYRGE